MSLDSSFSTMRFAAKKCEYGADPKVLEFAAYQGDLDFAREFLIANPKFAPSRACSTKLLHSAITKRDIAMVRLILTYKPELNPSSRLNLLSPLWIAVLYDCTEIAELLVREGARVNKRLGPHSVHDRLSSFLHVLATPPFAFPEHERLVQLLLERGADVDARDSKGYSPLHYAATLGRVTLVRKLLASGANPNAVNRQGETVLHTAAQSSKAEQLVPLVLGYGLDVRARDESGANALHYLARGQAKSLLAAKLLLLKGVPLNESEFNDGYTPLHLAINNWKDELIKLFLDHGADINAKSKTGAFPLYLTVKYGMSDTIHLLLSRGANIHERTNRGRTALHNACGNVLEKNIRILLEYGADVNAKDQDGVTPFSMIEYKNMNSAIKTVIKHFAKLTAQNCPLNDEDLEIMRQYPKLQSFYEDCLDEIARMKQEKFYNSFSFYFILSKSRRKLASLTKNLDFMSAFRKWNYEYFFPLYAHDLNVKLVNAVKMQDLLAVMEDRLNSIFREYFPDTVIQRILYFMSSEYFDI